MMNLIKEKTKIEYILIACCTCKRPNMLRKALNSVKQLVLPEGIKIELLVIDNDKDETAKDVVSSFDLPIKINYFVEEKRGISVARNRLLREALNLNATHIALFDDDELLDKNWLSELVRYYNSNENAHIISAPTYNKFMKKYPKYIEKNNIFKKSTTKKTGQKRNICASGNVFFSISLVREDGIFFDETNIFMGGEDGDFFSRASQAGYNIFWCNEAVNYEMVGNERANISWILKRYYYNGYSGTLLKFKNNKSFKKKAVYFFKTFFAIFVNAIFLFPSIFLGFTNFLNVLGMLLKTQGKLDALIAGIPLNYYEKICGD